LALVVLAATITAAGCSSLAGAIGSMLGPGQSSQASGEVDQAEVQPRKAEPARPEDSNVSVQAFQYQFDAFYMGLWSVGWFGYGEQNYKPGQGTIWEFANTGEDQPTIFERAYLRANTDGSQWWRLRLGQAEDTLVFEFLVGADGDVQRVRYRDPDSKVIGEFAPAQGRGPRVGRRAARSLLDTSWTSRPSG
jgi:hypothetical protein